YSVGPLAHTLAQKSPKSVGSDVSDVEVIDGDTHETVKLGDRGGCWLVLTLESWDKIDPEAEKAFQKRLPKGYDKDYEQADLTRLASKMPEVDVELLYVSKRFSGFRGRPRQSHEQVRQGGYPEQVFVGEMPDAFGSPAWTPT